MGLLSGIGNFMSSQGAGLLGAFQHPQATPLGYAPQGPVVDTPFGALQTPMNQADQVQQQIAMMNTEPSRMARLSALLRDAGTSLQGGHSDFQGGLRAKADADRANLMLEQEAQAAGLSPQEILAMKLNQKAFGENYASQFGDMVLNQGAIRNRGGVNIAGAPVIGAAGDRTRVTDPLTGGTDYSDARPPTFDEMTRRNQSLQAAQNAALQAEIRRRQLEEQARHNRASEGLGQQRINKPSGGGGRARSAVPALPPGFVLEK